MGVGNKNGHGQSKMSVVLSPIFPIELKFEHKVAMVSKHAAQGATTPFLDPIQRFGMVM